MKKFILGLFMLIVTPVLLWADTVSFEASINSSKISLSEVLQLTLTVTGVKEDLDPISLPTLDGFSAKYLGPSTSVSIVNGDYHSERAFIYNLFPNKVGHFQIPSITATIAGQTYVTKPIDVDVVGNSPALQADGVSGQAQGQDIQSLKDKILIMVSVDKTEAFLNERIPLSVKLLVNNVPMRDVQYPKFEKTGLSIDDLQKPQQYAQVLNGIKYDVVEFKTYIYPSHTGEVRIGPVQMAGNVIYKSGANNPFNHDNGFFGADIFNNFFDSYTARPVIVTSQPITIRVSDLPQDNRPEDFSGAVGQFDLQASVSPLQVKAGDPLTLKMAIKGSGNFKSFKMPVFHASEFKTYDPKIKDGADEKTAEQVIVPISAGVKEVPALHFSYFDPSLKDYRTLTQGPFAIQVTAPSPDQEFKAVGFSDLSREPANLVGQQFSFTKMFNKLHKGFKKLCQSVLFWASLGFILVTGISYFFWRRFQERLESDPAFARRLKAVKEAKQALSQARGYIEKGKTKDLYALLSKVLRDYLANKWHQSASSLSVEAILKQLNLAQIDEAHMAGIKAILNTSDLVCFAGADRDASQMQSDLTCTQDLIAYLEKSL